jgi:hypothetical protein
VGLPRVAGVEARAKSEHSAWSCLKRRTLHLPRVSLNLGEAAVALRHPSRRRPDRCRTCQRGDARPVSNETNLRGRGSACL